MLCYRDMTFCDFWRNCHGGYDCRRALTPDIHAAAAKWWGTENGSAPIATFGERPKCWVSATESAK